MQPHINILGARIDNVTLDQATTAIEEFIALGGTHQVLTVNLDFIRAAQQNREFLNVINGGDLVVADGMPVVWASRWCGAPLPERVTGVDLVDRCCAAAASHGHRVFLLGGEEGVAHAAAAVMTARHRGLTIAGTYSPPMGPFSDEDDKRMVGLIQQAQPHLLFVGFGAPRQDLWIARHRALLGVPVSIGVGGVFNFITGRVRRAPVWMQQSGLEWCYRLIQEPRRLWRRYIVDDMPVFASIMMESLRLRWLGQPAHAAGSLLAAPDGSPVVSSSALAGRHADNS